MTKSQALYAYIKNEILKKIKSGEYQVGERIPTEFQLCEMFHTSRTTIRKALDQLMMEGYLTRLQGNGTFVADKKLQQKLSNTVHHFRDQVKMQGKEPEVALISIDVIPADGRLQNDLSVQLDDPIQRIERVRKANGQPTQYEIAFIPWDVAPGITKDHAETSLYRTLQNNYDIFIHQTTEHIEIVLADEDVSSRLECEPGMPCFFIETVAKDSKGNNMEYSRAYFRGDKTNFVIERNYP